jgi:hypothetical protein
MNAKINMGMKGAFHIQVRHADGTITDHGIHKNRVVNQGLDAMGGAIPSGSTTLNALNGGVAVGTGNTAPAAGQTTLVAPLAVTSNGSLATVATQNAAPFANIWTSTYTFAVGAVVGNIAEVGMVLGTNLTLAANGPLFSRALIMVGGSPGTITLLSTDQLLVTYTMAYILETAGSGSVNVTTDGTPVAVNYQFQPCNLGFGSGGSLAANYMTPVQFENQGAGTTTTWWTNTAFVATTANGSTVNGASSATNGAYTPGSYTRAFNFHWNTGITIAARTMCNITLSCMQFQILFASSISLTSTQTMDFNVQLTWADAS